MLLDGTCGAALGGFVSQKEFLMLYKDILGNSFTGRSTRLGQIVRSRSKSQRKVASYIPVIVAQQGESEMNKTNTWTWYSAKKAGEIAGIEPRLLFEGLLLRGYVVRAIDGDELTRTGKRMSWLQEYHPEKPDRSTLKESFITMDVSSEDFKAFVAELKMGTEAVAAA